MDFSTLKVMMIPEGEVVQIEYNGSVLWKKPSAYKNWARYSLEADGKTIYNNGLGYKNQTRIRSGGAEQEQGGTTCTGFIPAKNGDTIRISGATIKNGGTAGTINICDSTTTNLGQWASNSDWGYGNLQGTSYAKGDYMVEETTGVWKWVVPPTDVGNIAYVRVGGFTGYGETGDKLIVTVNEEIK